MVSHVQLFHGQEYIYKALALEMEREEALQALFP